MDSQIIVKGNCRRCNSPLSKEVTGSPVFRCIVECNICHYRTILRDDPVVLPIEESLRSYLNEDQIKSILNDFKDPDLNCIRAVDTLLRIAYEMIKKNRTVTIAGLMHLMNRLDVLEAEFFTDPNYNEAPATGTAVSTENLICQLMYLLLSVDGAVELPKDNINSEVITKIVGQSIFPLLSDVVVIAKLIQTAIYEKSINFSFKEGQLIASKLEKHELMVEEQVNMLLQEQRDNLRNKKSADSSVVDVILSASTNQAIALTTGVRIEDVVYIYQNHEALVDQKVAGRKGNLICIVDQYLSQEYSLLFQKLSFTLDKLYRFKSPCFFDTGVPRYEHLNPIELIAEAAAMNWSAYYPCFEFTSPANGSTIYVTSPRRLQGMLMTINECQAFILHQLNETYCKTISGTELKELRTLIRQTHRDLEVKAGQIFNSSGWQCLTSVENVKGRPIPCGEIDLLATIVIRDAKVVLIGEVKNSDMAMFKPGFVERSKDIINHAEDQLKRKGDWICDHWNEVLSLFDQITDETIHVKRKYIARLVITARPIAPHFFNQYTGCGISSLDSLALDLLQEHPNNWKQDWQIKLQEVNQ